MNKKKKLIIIILISIISIIGIICLALFVEHKIVKENLEIKLKGKKEIVINYGEKYKDEGSISTCRKINLTKKIKTTNNINYEKLGTYYYKYKITYKNVTKEVKRKIKIVDKVEPEIKLNGEKEIVLKLNSKYEEKGATATDNYDKDLTDKIKIEGKVDTSKVGEYKIIYKVEDQSKNSKEVTRVVKVIEEKIVQNNTQIQTNNKQGEPTYIKGILVANKTYALPSNYNPGGLTSSFNNAFEKMRSDASREGASLRIISGFRSYSDQKRIYNNYVSRDGQAAADRYSARPGHSEHQTGLAADINSLDQSFEHTKEGKWLNNNCYKYGFIIRYVKGKEHETGYMFEPWHIRYVGVDIATKLYNNGNWITLESYLGITSKYQ